jgi:hypothetical protein
VYEYENKKQIEVEPADFFILLDYYGSELYEIQDER